MPNFSRIPKISFRNDFRWKIQSLDILLPISHFLAVPEIALVGICKLKFEFIFIFAKYYEDLFVQHHTGQKFAMMEEKIVLGNFLRKFRVESMEKREDLKLLPELVLRTKNGIQVKISNR